MPDTTTSFTGSIPANYEQYLGPYLFEPYAKELIERITTTGVKTVLEIACGTGRVTRHLRKKFDADVRLIATDLNADMINIGKQLSGDHSVDWQVADAQRLPFDNNYFDLVVCQFGLMFVPDKPQALREMFRVLQPGGVLMVSTWDSLQKNPAFDVGNELIKKFFPVDTPQFFRVPYSMYDDIELKSLTEGAGFRDISVSLVKLQGTSESALATATGLIEGSPIYPAIVERNKELLPLIKTKLQEELAAQFGSSPMISPMQAWIIEARK